MKVSFGSGLAGQCEAKTPFIFSGTLFDWLFNGEDMLIVALQLLQNKHVPIALMYIPNLRTEYTQDTCKKAMNWYMTIRSGNIVEALTFAYQLISKMCWESKFGDILISLISE